MDFSNERYVRLYTRNTTTWKRLGWQGQCVLLQLLRIVDRAGVLDIEDMDPVEAMVLHTGMPTEIVSQGLDRILALGSATCRGSSLIIPRFLEAQECAQSDRQRQRESRERRRDMAGTATDVTNRDQTSRASNLRDEIVTPAVPSVPSVPSEISSEELGGETEASVPAGTPVARRPDIAGFTWYGGTLERDATACPALMTWREQYAWIGRRPANELEAVQRAVRGDPWCQQNKHLVSPGHMVKNWQRYLGGPPKAVLKPPTKPTASGAWAKRIATTAEIAAAPDGVVAR